MLTESITLGIAKVLAGQLLDGIQLNSGVRKIVQVPMDQLFGKVDRTLAKKTIEKLARSISDELTAFPSTHEDNAGAARAAASTFIDVLQVSDLSASRMVALNLDPIAIEEYLTTKAGPALNTASAERSGHVLRAISHLSKLLVANAADLPGIQVAFMQAMLASRRNSGA